MTFSTIELSIKNVDTASLKQLISPLKQHEVLCSENFRYQYNLLPFPQIIKFNIMMKLSHIYFKIFKDFLRIQIERNFVEFHVCAIFIFFYLVKAFILIVDQQLKHI